MRVMYPRVVRYQFTTRKNETVNASRFDAYLVGQVPTEYVMATVPFSFKDPDKPARALQKYVAGTAWNMTSALLDQNSKPQWNGSPNKVVVVLEAPTKTAPLMQGSEIEKSLSSYIDPPMRLDDILQAQRA